MHPMSRSRVTFTFFIFSNGSDRAIARSKRVFARMNCNFRNRNPVVGSKHATDTIAVAN